MKALSKRLLAMFLSVTMCISLVQVTAFSAENDPTPTETESPQEITVYQLNCPTAEHIHDEACYALKCEQSEDPNHTHDRSCYALTCEKSEHVHNLTCYQELDGTYQKELSDGTAIPSTHALACGNTNGHYHSFFCGVPAPTPVEPTPGEGEKPNDDTNQGGGTAKTFDQSV